MKLIGIAIVFICTTSIGIYTSYKTKLSVNQLHEFLSLMNYIKNQIEYFNAPINSIYSSYESENDFFNDFLYEISSCGWNNALANTNKLFLPKKVIELLNDYGDTLGKTTREQQITVNEYYTKLLENEYNDLKNKAPEKIKLTMAVSLYIGIMLIILFI